MLTRAWMLLTLELIIEMGVVSEFGRNMSNQSSRKAFCITSHPATGSPPYEETNFVKSG